MTKIAGSGSVPKSQGSAALFKRIVSEMNIFKGYKVKSVGYLAV
jgi:hypothetical protein